METLPERNTCGVISEIDIKYVMRLILAMADRCAEIWSEGERERE